LSTFTASVSLGGWWLAESGAGWQTLLGYVSSISLGAWVVVIEGTVLVRLGRDQGLRLLPFLALGYELGQFAVKRFSTGLYGTPGGDLVAAMFFLGAFAMACTVAMTRLESRRPDPDADSGGTLFLVLRSRYLIGLVFLVAATRIVGDLPNYLYVIGQGAWLADHSPGRYEFAGLAIGLGVVVYAVPRLAVRLGAAMTAVCAIALALASLPIIALDTRAAAVAVVAMNAGTTIAGWALFAAWLAWPDAHKLKARLAVIMGASYLGILATFAAQFAVRGPSFDLGWYITLVGLAALLWGAIGAVTVRGREPEPVDLEAIFD